MRERFSGFRVPCTGMPAVIHPNAYDLGGVLPPTFTLPGALHLSHALRHQERAFTTSLRKTADNSPSTKKTFGDRSAAEQWLTSVEAGSDGQRALLLFAPNATQTVRGVSPRFDGVPCHTEKSWRILTCSAE